MSEAAPEDDPKLDNDSWSTEANRWTTGVMATLTISGNEYHGEQEGMPAYHAFENHLAGVGEDLHVERIKPDTVDYSRERTYVNEEKNVTVSVCLKADDHIVSELHDEYDGAEEIVDAFFDELHAAVVDELGDGFEEEGE